MERVFSTNSGGKIYIHKQKNGVELLILHHTQKLTPNGSKKLLEENIWEKLHDTEFGNDFLGRTPKAEATKVKIDNWGYINIKNSCASYTQEGGHENEGRDGSNASTSQGC